MSTPWRDLVERLVDHDPIVEYEDGYGEAIEFCTFCPVGEDDWKDDSPAKLHKPDCPWIASMLALGRDLGDHTVHPTIIDVESVDREPGPPGLPGGT